MQHRAIRHAIGWLGVAVMSPGVSWAQTTAMPGMAPAPAREDPIAIVRGLLTSPDAKTQAWGAWYAGRDVMTDLIPGLIAVVSQHANAGTLAEHAARDVALDALIQLRAEVPADLIARLVEDRPAHALILAARSQDAGDTLLDLAQANPDAGEHWFAAANLLLSRRKPGFARVLVAKLTLRIDVYVSDDGNTSGGYGSGRSIGCRWGPGLVDRDLPPRAAYELTTRARPDVAVLALGPVPVYYERHLSTTGVMPTSPGTSIHGPTTEQRLQYVAALMDMNENRLPIRARTTHSIKWTDQPSLDAAIQSFRADTRRRFAQLVSELVDAGLVTKEEAADFEPVINVMVDDVRTERSTTLTTTVMP
jgi:hypothetical protein